VEELRSRAQDVLITREISREEQLDKVEPAQDLLEMEGMSARLAYLLAGRGIITRDDLAEQSVDELLEVEGMEPDFAGELIMQARAAWFDDGDEEDAA
ncbi:MAG: helix-hairpin-helix domain-containing protein, partial [Pseudomonadota bacterium]|nr:helix-hairpin-helix domain-containing protein [Pseudomonadota bacterium]